MFSISPKLTNAGISLQVRAAAGEAIISLDLKSETELPQAEQILLSMMTCLIQSFHSESHPLKRRLRFLR